MLEDFAKQLKIDIPVELRPFIVACIKGKSNGKVSFTYPVYATGFPLMVKVIGDRPQIEVNGKNHPVNSNLNIAGQIYKADIKLYYKNHNFDSLGIILMPTAPYYLFHTKPDHLNNKWTALSALQNIDDTILKQRQGNCSDRNRLTVLFDYIKSLIPNRLDPIEWLDKAVFEILKSNGNLDVDNLAADLIMSGRHFRRQFKEYIGVPPKYYCNVIRFNSVFRCINKGSNKTLLDTALECGYFDQSHFIRDFKSIMGVNPKTFLNSDVSYLKEYMGIKPS